VTRVAQTLPTQSRTLSALVRNGKIAIVGAMYDVVTGDMEFLEDPDLESP
jgi:carbonic anhydrase/SulP family sulfate permease